MRQRTDWKRWRWAIASTAAGCAIFGLAVANGNGWEMVWLPAVLLGASWHHDRNGNLESCLRRLRRPARNR